MALNGSVAIGFGRVRDVFARHFEDGLEIGAGLAVLLRGAPVVDLWGGYADRAQTRPWTAATLAPIYSATKPIAALALQALLDDHAILLSDRVAAVWPEFAAHGKARLTIAQALSHQADLPGFVNPIDPALWLDPPALAAKLADTEPLWEPGTAHGYHPATWGYIVGEIARRVSRPVGSLGSFLRSEICDTRNIDFWIGLPETEDARVADIRRPSQAPDLGEITPIKRAAFLEKWSGPNRAGPEWRRVEIPSANGHGTALALAQLYGLFATRDEDICSRDGWDELTRPRAFGPDLVLPYTLDWRAGILGNNLGFFGPNPNALGHYGWGGSCGVADQDIGLSLGYVTNRQSHHLMGDPRALALIDAVYACLS